MRPKLMPPATVVVCALAGCSPSLDWRELRPDGASVAVDFPCKPSVYARSVRLAETRVELQLHACSASGLTWALAYADVVDPARVAPALRELRHAAVANVGGVAERKIAWQAPGATPNAEAVRLFMAGRLPDGKAVEEQVAVFAYATRAYQLTVVGPRVQGDAVDQFFGSVHVRP